MFYNSLALCFHFPFPPPPVTYLLAFFCLCLIFLLCGSLDFASKYLLPFLLSTSRLCFISFPSEISSYTCFSSYTSLLILIYIFHHFCFFLFYLPHLPMYLFTSLPSFHPNYIVLSRCIISPPASLLLLSPFTLPPSTYLPVFPFSFLRLSPQDELLAQYFQAIFSHGSLDSGLSVFECKFVFALKNMILHNCVSFDLLLFPIFYCLCGVFFPSFFSPFFFTWYLLISKFCGYDR